MCRWNQSRGSQLLPTGSSGGTGQPSRYCRAGIQEEEGDLRGFKTHRLRYAAAGREVNKGIAIKMSIVTDVLIEKRGNPTKNRGRATFLLILCTKGRILRASPEPLIELIGHTK